MSLLDLGSLLVLVEPEGEAARAVFKFPENASCRRFGLAIDAPTDEDNDTLSEFDLRSQMFDADVPVPVHLALSFNPGPKDVSKGFVFGSDRETCDVLLAKHKDGGISGNHFSISVDWRTGNPLITCLTPNDRASIRILLGGSWELYLRKAWKVVEPGMSNTIMISKDMRFVVHNPGREQREPMYSKNVQKYFKKCQDAVPELTHLKLYDPEPTPLFISRSRGLSGMTYFTTSTVVGEKVVLCEAKSHQNWTGDSETFIVKRYRNIRKNWKEHAETKLRTLRELKHRHIIPLEDIITDTLECMPVYFPEPPETLADRRIRGPLAEIDAGEVLAQVFEALKFLHANHIVHGSLYPGNIRIKHSAPLSVKLSEIGLHPYVELENPEERQLYASQLKSGGQGDPLPVMDIWSAGVVGLNLISPDGLPPRMSHLQRRWVRILAQRSRALYHTEKHGPTGKKDAALFLTRVLKPDFGERLTAEQCLQEPWIQLWRLPLSYDREVSQDLSDPFYYMRNGAGLLDTFSEEGFEQEEAKNEEESEEEERSGEETETEEPRTRKSKGKQPQPLLHTKGAPSSNPRRQPPATPQSSRYPGGTAIESCHKSVERSDSINRQVSVAPPDLCLYGKRTRGSHHLSARPGSLVSSNQVSDKSTRSPPSQPHSSSRKPMDRSRKHPYSRDISPGVGSSRDYNLRGTRR